MSAIARMFLIEGKEVSGSDAVSSPVTDELIKLGAKIDIGSAGKGGSGKATQESVALAGVELVVYTIAIPQDNAELAAARAEKIPLLTYPETLGMVSREKFTIAIAGTHGKTTTTAMVATAMIDAGLDPTVVVGSLMKEQKSNFIAGKSKYFVAEACEYKRSFLNLNPKIIVITNIDDDHLDYYGTLEGVQKGFREFVEKLGSDGVLICNPNDEKVKPVIEGLDCNIVDYTKMSGDFKLKVPGKHNINNAKAAAVVLGVVGVSEAPILKSLSQFSGTWRRFDFRGKTSSGALVYDDYAHHPSEIFATLAGAREFFGNKRIIAVFQPHLYSRTKEHAHEFAGAFADADVVILAPIYAAREPKDETISSEILAEKMKSQMTALAASGAQKEVVVFKNFDEIIAFLKKTSTEHDVIMTMGAGDINTVAERMVHA